MSAVDEILASGRYTDRRGRTWKRRIAWSTASGLDMWSYPHRLEPLLGGPVYRLIDADQMRLLIERDQHRDECPGLSACNGHPVPSVITPYVWGSRDFEVYAAWQNATGTFEQSLPEAMDAARAMAVGE